MIEIYNHFDLRCIGRESHCAALWRDEVLLLRELGYGASDTAKPEVSGLEDALTWLDRLESPLATRLLAHTPTDVMGARVLLRERLGKMVA